MANSHPQWLVHLDDAPRSRDRLQLARQLAEQQSAVLTALYAVPPYFLELPYVLGIGSNIPASLQQLDDARRDGARALFEQAMKLPGASVDWAECCEPPIIGTVAQKALCADLLVLGQHDPGAGTSVPLPPDFAESVLAASGKPALIVPYTGDLSGVGRTVLIAWNESREAARAVTAALPLLRRADRVHVASWGLAALQTGGNELGLARYLRLHGVEPTWHSEHKVPDHLGELLLSFAADAQANLLVMGCYGHSRVREWVLGGVTRTVLRGMTLPVLMAS